MTKTTWLIIDKTDNTEAEFAYYHFGKEPKFPTWYMEEGHNYNIEMLWNYKLVTSLNTFYKCLVHHYIIK